MAAGIYHLEELLRNRDRGIREELLMMPEPEVAELLLALDNAERVLVFRALPGAFPPRSLHGWKLRIRMLCCEP